MRLRSIFFFALLLCSLRSVAQPIICKDPVLCLYGLKNDSGVWIVPPRYTLIDREIQNDRYRVMLNSKVGVIDGRGKEIIAPVYRSVELMYPAHPGAVNGKVDSLELKIYQQLSSSFMVSLNGLHGVISRQGEILLPVDFRSIGPFQDNIAVCTTSDGKLCCTDIHGITGYFPPGAVYIPQQGSAGVLPRRYVFRQLIKVPGAGVQQRYGVCDETGKIILPCTFQGIAKPGTLPGVICAYENWKAGFFSRDGERLTESVYELPGDYSPYSKYRQVRRTEGWGVLGANAKEIIPCRYDSIAEFQSYALTDSTAFLCRANGRWEIFNADGRKLTPVSYTGMIAQELYGAKVLSVKTGGKWGAVTLRGDELIPAQYDTVFRFGSFVLYWSPTDVTALRYGKFPGQIALYGFQAEKDDFNPVFPYSYNGKDTSGPVVPSGSNYDFGYYGYTAPPDPKNAYANSMYLPEAGGLLQTHIPQTVSADSTWFIPRFPVELCYEWAGERWDPEALQFRIAVRKKRGEKPTMIATDALLHNSEYYWLSLVYKDQYDSPNGILRSDGVLLFDSLPGMKVSGYGFSKKGTALFLTRTVDDQQQNVVDANGRFLIDARWEGVWGFGSDTAWVARKQAPGECPQRWNRLVLSTGKLLLPEDGELVAPPDDWHEIQIAGTEKGFGLFNEKKMKFVTAPVYRFIFRMDDTGDYFSVTTFSGKTGVMDRRGKLVVDTAWSRIVLSRKPGYHGKEQDDYRYVLSRGDEKLVFDQHGSHAFDDAYCKKTVGDVLERGPASHYLSRSETPRLVTTTGIVAEWQCRLLADSLFTSPLGQDYRCVHEYNSGSENRAQFDVRCDSWDEQQTFERNYWNIVIREIAMSNASVLSMRRIGGHEGSWGKPGDLSYQNFLLVNDTARYVTLDSLFTGHEWEAVIIKAIAEFLDKHPYIEAPCVNTNAYPYLVNERFLLYTNGLALYPPDWKDKQDHAAWDTPVFIPWEKLQPYLRADVKEKLGLK